LIGGWGYAESSDESAASAQSDSVPTVSILEVHGDLPPEVASRLHDASRVAVDTETSGLSWESDQLLLCQLFSMVTGPVLLRKVASRPINLANLMNDPGVVKVFHYAPFDLRFLEAQWDAPATSVSCTKTASRLLDATRPAADHSLQPLLKRTLGISIEKGAVRTSDWGVPELSAEQLEYAVSDVIHLLALEEHLRKRMDNEVADLYERVCAYMPIDAHLAVAGFPDPLRY
jgi:ribonuclease D